MFKTIISAIIAFTVVGEFLFGCFVYIWRDITAEHHFKEWNRRIDRGEIDCEPEWPKFPHFK